MGAEVKGYALAPATTPSLYEVARISDKIDSDIGDIKNLEQLQSSMVKFDPNILIHMAAQPLVRLSYKDPIETSLDPMIRDSENFAITFLSELIL